MSRLVCFGLGYTARVFARVMMARGWSVLGTTRSAEKAYQLRAEGFDTEVFTGEAPGEAVSAALVQATHVLVCAGPGGDGDPVLAHHGTGLADAGHLEWIGYLSTVGVYGDHDGAWVDEDTPAKPKSTRSVQRAAAEREWLSFGARAGKAVHVFRLAGIYGPGRGPLEKVREGNARRIVKPGQVFNRIHVDDIAAVLDASIARPRAGAVYNVADGEPAPPQDVIAFAAECLGLPPPPEVAFADASLSTMGRTFYGENKRVSNARIRSELGVRLAYPTYREGIAALAGRSAPEPAHR